MCLPLCSRVSPFLLTCQFFVIYCWACLSVACNLFLGADVALVVYNHAKGYKGFVLSSLRRSTHQLMHNNHNLHACQPVLGACIELFSSDNEHLEPQHFYTKHVRYMSEGHNIIPPYALLHWHLQNVAPLSNLLGSTQVWRGRNLWCSQPKKYWQLLWDLTTPKVVQISWR